VNNYPEFTFTMNGRVGSLLQGQAAFAACSSLMRGKIAWSLVADPWSFAMVADQL
jgi:hypothetical protein